MKNGPINKFFSGFGVGWFGLPVIKGKPMEANEIVALIGFTVIFVSNMLT
jgi:hypothetical protein